MRNILTPLLILGVMLLASASFAEGLRADDGAVVGKAVEKSLKNAGYISPIATMAVMTPSHADGFASARTPHGRINFSCTADLDMAGKGVMVDCRPISPPS
jgi:hypothetical protein